MENATSEQLEFLTDDEELKRLCVVFGVTQSNMLYRLLSAKDKEEMFEQIREFTTVMIKSERGGQKCEFPQVWDEARGVCV